MTDELERTFLVDATAWSPTGSGQSLQQGYLNEDGRANVLIRVSATDALLTITGPAGSTPQREFIYTIPSSDAQALLKL